MTRSKAWISSLILILSLFSTGAIAQEEEAFDIPPPPPIEDYEEGPIEDMPYEDGDIVDGPVYEVPEGEDMPQPITPPPGIGPGAPALPRNSSNGQFGFTNPNLGNKGGSGGNGAAFGTTEGKLQFKIVEGEYWEKGKKRTRGKKTED